MSINVVRIFRPSRHTFVIPKYVQTVRAQFRVPNFNVPNEENLFVLSQFSYKPNRYSAMANIDSARLDSSLASYLIRYSHFGIG